jgi:hypothetical protein
MPTEPWSTGPRPTAIPARSADTGNGDEKNPPQSSRTSVGRLRSGGVNAMARALAGCMWALAKQVPVTPEGQDRLRLNAELPSMANVQRKRRVEGTRA